MQLHVVTFLPNFETRKVKKLLWLIILRSHNPRYQSELILQQHPGTIMDKSLETLLHLW